MRADSPGFLNDSRTRNNQGPVSQIPKIPLADYSPPNGRPKLVTKPFDNGGFGNGGQRKDKAPRKAIR